MGTRSHGQLKAAPVGSFTPAPRDALQRKCACGGAPGVAGACEGCSNEKLRVQRHAAHQAGTTAAPATVREALSSPGQPLDARTRAFMEPRFGFDFSRVRVHTDARATQSARALGAQAYTVGKEIVFGAGQYAPETERGRALIAHELTHTVQQGDHAHPPQVALPLSGPQDAAEVEAEQAARSVMRGESFSAGRGQAVHVARRVPIPADLPAEERRRAEDYLNEQALRRGRNEPPRGPTVYMCSKGLTTSPIGRHAFFRVGGDSPGFETYSLEPADRGGDCYQGQPVRNYPDDFNSQDATCEMTNISLSCLQARYAAYPVGHYCTRGPNSNTFVGHVARSCGHANPDPPGFTPGIDDNPPPAGTHSPSPTRTLLWCGTKQC